MSIDDDSLESLIAKAATCRRTAEGMGADPLVQNLIEIAEEYEARATALQASVPVFPAS
jgi:hypothetical protein